MMRGDDVKELQELLAAQGFKLSADGVFGSGTDKAVKSFQQKHGLVVDGIVGSATMSILAEQA